MRHPKKVGTLSLADSEETKQTNEIGMFIPLLDGIDIAGKDITADALLTQRKLATYLAERRAHYHFIVKGNQATLQADIALLFQGRKDLPDYVSVSPPEHGRIEARRIWCSTALNAHLDFPHVGQVFRIEREVLHKKSGKRTLESALGVTSRPPEQADPQRVLEINRGHWVIENRCHYVIDWNFDEDRCRIRSGHGPENITRLRRFAVGVIQCFSKGKSSVAEKLRKLNRNTRLVFDYLRMTKNSTQPCLL
ncbi:MAG: ISAs1 family transposase [Acidiferrobacterales bacterium]